MKSLLLGATILIQGTLMAIDEFYCHRRREIPRFERIGHPLDTLTVLICLLIALLAPWSDTTAPIFIAAAVFACIFVTKDEFIHARKCNGLEHWVHAMLFVIHPVVFAVVYNVWKASAAEPWQLIPIFAQFAVVSAFCIYQAVYWNFVYVRTRKRA